MDEFEKFTQLGLEHLVQETVSQVFVEERRRIAETSRFLDRLCLLDRRLMLWNVAWRSGGVLSYSEIEVLARKLGIRSSDTVSRYLRLYLKHGFVVQRPGGYVVIGPRWLENN